MPTVETNDNLNKKDLKNETINVICNRIYDKEVHVDTADAIIRIIKMLDNDNTLYLGDGLILKLEDKKHS